jgi:hypothetical protein
VALLTGVAWRVGAGARKKKKKRKKQRSRGARGPAKSESCALRHSFSILFFPPLFAFGYESEVHAIVLDPQDKSRSVHYKSKVWEGKRGAPEISKKKRERRERRKGEDEGGKGRGGKRRRMEDERRKEEERARRARRVSPRTRLLKIDSPVSPRHPHRSAAFWCGEGAALWCGEGAPGGWVRGWGEGGGGNCKKEKRGW